MKVESDKRRLWGICQIPYLLPKVLEHKEEAVSGRVAWLRLSRCLGTSHDF